MRRTPDAPDAPFARAGAGRVPDALDAPDAPDVLDAQDAMAPDAPVVPNCRIDVVPNRINQPDYRVFLVCQGSIVNQTVWQVMGVT